MNRPVDHVNAFEYPTFKIPYEVMNQGFRNIHREMEKRKHDLCQRVERINELLEIAKEKRNMKLPIQTMLFEFKAARDAWQNFQDTARGALSQMEQYTNILNQNTYRLRIELFPIAEVEDPHARWKINRDRTCRFICSYLLRCGLVQTANLLSSKTGLYIANYYENLVFNEAKGIFQMIKEKKTKAILAWINNYRSRLKKNKSRLELAVRMQDVVDFLRKGQRAHALKYARMHLVFKDVGEISQEEQKEINQIWALLGVNVKTRISVYSSLLDDSRYDRLADLFREEFTRLFDLPYQSAFSLALQCGLAAYKTPQCTPGGNEMCITCHPTAFTLADGLPHAHTGLSIIRCAHTGELLNEDNPPWMILKTGRVYGERTLQLLRRDDKVHCSDIDEWVSVKDVARLYIL